MRILLFSIIVALQGSIVVQCSDASIVFSNYQTLQGIDAPIFDETGNALVGTNYLATGYSGGSQATMFPAVEPPMCFHTGGYVVSTNSSYLRTFTNILPGQTAWFQARAWDRRLGETYEKASARRVGGYGESGFLLLHSGGCFQCGPFYLTGLQSFSLRRITGIAVRATKEANGVVRLEWAGTNAFYQVQVETSGGAWQDFGAPTTNNFTKLGSTKAFQFFRIIGADQG